MKKIKQTQQDEQDKISIGRKKLLIWLLILSILIFIAIYLISNNKISDKDIFERNLKCQDYLDTFIKENTPVTAVINKVSVFYSPKENSCIWVFEFYDVWKSEDYTVSRIFDSYSIYWLLWNTKKSSYTLDKRPKLWEMTCKYESDFMWKQWEYECDDSNSKWEELRLKEIEWLKNR